MFKAIKNLILIVIICFSATGIPVYANLVFNYIISEDYVEYNVNVISNTQDNHEVQIEFYSNNPNLPLEFDSNKPLSFKVYLNEQEIKDVEVDITKQSGDTTTFSFHLTPDSLDVPNGDYLIKVQPLITNITSAVDPIDINVSFQSELSYISTDQDITSNKTALTLYFPNSDYSKLIPITRIIPYTTMPLRATINELYKGPNPNMGLPSNSPIPKVSNINLNKGQVRVYLPKEMGIYDDYSTNARIAFDSFVGSLTSIDEVDAVQFYINWKIQSDAFHGMAVDQPIKQDTSPKMYVGYRTETNRLLLLPTVIGRNLSVSDTFNNLKYSSNIDLYNSKVYPPVPERIELLDYNLTDGLLSLTFNENFLKAINNEDEFSGFMIDSLIYTYCSYPEVNAVKFNLADNNQLGDNQIFNKEIYPTGLINLEQ